MSKRRRREQTLDEPRMNLGLIASTDAADLVPQWSTTTEEPFFTRKSDGVALTAEEAGAVIQRCEEKRRTLEKLREEERHRCASRGDVAGAEVDAIGKRPIPVDLQALAEALDWHDERGASWYLDLESGESLIYSEDFDDDEMSEAIKNNPDRYLFIEPRESREDFGDMEDFTRTVRDRSLAGNLEVALNGRGAFRRFKDVLLNYPKERERWFEFKNRRLEEAAREWLETKGIEPVPRSKDHRAT